MSTIIESGYWPFAVLLLSVLAVITFISRWRFHPFVALILTAILVGFMTPDLPMDAGMAPLVAAVELPMMEFGIMAGKIAWVIALAAVIGTAMMESGAAEQIVNWLLKTLGQKQAAMALVISGATLSIPVFFDTVFFLLIPLGITLAHKTGKDFVLYVAAIAGGAVITHSIVPPTPGPLIMAETLGLELGTVILIGVLAAIIPAMAVLFASKWLNKKWPIPIRIQRESTAAVHSPPSLFFSFLPILAPLLMISFASIIEAITVDGEVPGWIAFQGNKNIAMGVGAFLAIYLWAKTRNLSKNELWLSIIPPLQVGGIIILITSAGGAYGAMIAYSGIGDSIAMLTERFSIHYLVLAWVIAAVMKTAQGSGTVSMITSAAIMSALMGPEVQLPYHPIYIFLSMGFGSLFVSWMNDSGFWVVVKMSGFTEKEGLKIWTVLLAFISLVGLIQVLVLSRILPLI
ncbi:MAG: SLC13 family permease [Cyclobacteriaceae bacterium]